jgi:hypothetical protein
VSRVAALLLAGGIAAVLLPAAPASASCSPVTYYLLRQCGDPCALVAGAYYTADARSGGVLPDHPFYCLEA